MRVEKVRFVSVSLEQRLADSEPPCNEVSRHLVTSLYYYNIFGAETREKRLPEKMDTSKAALTDRAKRKRTVVRAATTKLINEVAAMADPTTVGELQTKFDLLVLKEDTLKELDSEIEQGIDDEALEEEITCSESYKERISVAKTKLKGMLLVQARLSGRAFTS